MPKTGNIEKAGPRQRLLDASYRLFAKRGVENVGIDSILEESRCAKATLYSNFDSKLGLAIAFLDRREQLWTRDWLEAEVTRRAQDPDRRLLAIFDVFNDWFQRKDFEGCSFINVLLESEPNSTIHIAAAAHLANIRSIIGALAEQARLKDVSQFAQVWHMLMKGSIVSACEGNRNAAREAKRAARLVLDGWPRK